MIEVDETETKSFLTMRTLKIDKEVVSPIEKIIPLNVQEPSFKALCQNGQLILFSKISRFDDDHRAVFIDLESEKVTYSDFPIKSYTETYVNTESGELWVWDKFTKILSKISSDKTEEMASLPYCNAIFHADKKGQLYVL